MTETTKAICESCDGSGLGDPMLPVHDPANGPCEVCGGEGAVSKTTPKLNPGQIWKSVAVTIHILSTQGDSIRFVTNMHPEQSLRESEFLSWLRGIRATLQEAANG